MGCEGKTRRAHRRQFLALIEVTMALVLLGVLTAAFHATLHRLRQAQARTGLESVAVLVLDNTLERVIHAAEPPDAAGIIAICRDEFSRTPLAADPDLNLVCELRNGAVVCEVRNLRQANLASLIIPVPGRRSP